MQRRNDASFASIEIYRALLPSLSSACPFRGTRPIDQDWGLVSIGVPAMLLLPWRVLREAAAPVSEQIAPFKGQLEVTFLLGCTTPAALLREGILEKSSSSCSRA